MVYNLLVQVYLITKPELPMSIQTLNPFLSPSTTSSAKTNSANTAIHKASTIEKTDAPAISNEIAPKEDDISLSSRAQKIQMLNEEFFPGGPSSVTITPDFIQRLHEYGFISESEANDLSSGTTAESESTDTVGALSDEIKRITQGLEADSSLIGILNRADDIINNLDGTKPTHLTNNIKLVDVELNAYLNSDEAAQLTETEKQSMEQLSLALTLADKLNPNNLTSPKLNSYLSFM